MLFYIDSILYVKQPKIWSRTFSDLLLICTITTYNLHLRMQLHVFFVDNARFTTRQPPKIHSGYQCVVKRCIVIWSSVCWSIAVSTTPQSSDLMRCSSSISVTFRLVVRARVRIIYISTRLIHTLTEAGYWYTYVRFTDTSAFISRLHFNFT